MVDTPPPPAASPPAAPASAGPSQAGAPRTEVAPVPAAPGLSTMAVAVVVVAALYFGREIFVPFALAVLLSFALAPLVALLRRCHVPRPPAVILVVTVAALAILAIGGLVAGQVTSLAGNLPFYQRNIQAKIHSIQSSFPGTGIVERASRVLKELQQEIAKEDAKEDRSAAEADAAAPPGGPQPAPEIEPIPVQIRQPDPAPLQMLQSVIGPLLGPLATAGIVVVFVVFMLLQREDLRDRLIRLAGTRDLQRTTTALDEAARRVSRYLLMQFVVNVTYGVPIGIGLWLIGVPNPLLWGLLATLLRFVPYIGPFVAAAFPLILAVAVDPGWSMLLWTAALFIVVEVISNNVVEPLLYGSSTGLSPVAIIVAAIFWTWLWGPVGLLLSTPLTVCLVVLGRHVPQLQFLDVILGSEAVLEPEQRFYQRLLAGDPEEATEQAEEFLKESRLVDFYDQVALEALRLAEYDRARGSLDAERQALILDGMATVVENLSDHEEEPDASEAASGAEQAAPLAAAGDALALCIAARSQLDEAAAVILAGLLERQGMQVRVHSSRDVAGGNLDQIDRSGVRLVWLSCMSGQSFLRARYLVRRLRRRMPGVPILVGFWTLTAADIDRRDPTGADATADSFRAAVERTRRVLEPAAPPADVEPLPVPAAGLS